MTQAFSQDYDGKLVDQYVAQCRCLLALEAGDMRTRDGEGRETTFEVIVDFASQIATIGAAFPNPDLLRAYQCIAGEPGNSEADALLAEIKRRGLER